MARASDLERERRREERERRELAKFLKRGRRGKIGGRLVGYISKGKSKRKKNVKDDVVEEKVVIVAGYTLKVPRGAKTSFGIKVRFNNSKVKVGQKEIIGSRWGFARVKIYKKSDLLHMLHMLRIETERELSGKIELMGLNGESEDQIRERLLRMHEVERQRGRKAQGNAYLEVVASFEDKRLVKKLMKELERRFNSDVYAVLHYDENVPHAHIIISWRNKQGKAIRLRRGDFRSVWRQAIETLQPSREVANRKGVGRPYVPFYILRKAYMESRWDEVIERLRLETRLYQIALREVEGRRAEEEGERFSLKKAFYDFIKRINPLRYRGWVGEDRFREDFIRFLKDNSYLKKTDEDYWYEVSKELEEALGRPLFARPLLTKPEVFLARRQEERREERVIKEEEEKFEEEELRGEVEEKEEIGVGVKGEVKEEEVESVAREEVREEIKEEEKEKEVKEKEVVKEEVREEVREVESVVREEVKEEIKEEIKEEVREEVEEVEDLRGQALKETSIREFMDKIEDLKRQVLEEEEREGRKSKVENIQKAQFEIPINSKARGRTRRR